jgi:hypothetical protein
MEGSVSVRRAAKQKNAKKAGGFLVFAQKRYLCGKVFWGILRKKRIAKNSLKTGISGLDNIDIHIYYYLYINIYIIYDNDSEFPI